ncbi:DNA polymerase III subunit delta (plasmid) [Leptolyngbya sp. BL0902]|uniref:DNA polymerase III subunit delta n=1 Tax=Leptolyngbya sp. BL0902 TaxID=1115757 RepID=UPI0018E7E05C|nr:DNA polymerase III subunit delta [Leptolyngbya sp. BL0902]QQE67361.1 DNA polymerase III subunit delta [Leptolyngbya sp. BL0902]
MPLTEHLPMPLTLLVGDDTHLIQTHLDHLKAELDPAWRSVNVHTFEAAHLKADDLSRLLRTQVYPTACSPPMAGDTKLVIVTEGRLSAQHGEDLAWVDGMPNTTHLVLCLDALDKRTKVAKRLIQHGTLYPYTALSPWDEAGIKAAVKAQAQASGVQMGRGVLSYLAEAIGNDRQRMESELTKLTLCPQPVTLALAQALVPNQTQTALQLVDAVRQGQPAQVATLFNALDTVHPGVILHTALSQFRTWFKVKVALKSKHLKTDTDIAQFAGLGNPKRLYYLRQEVNSVSMRRLSETVIRLQALSTELKTGLSRRALGIELMHLAHRP